MRGGRGPPAVRGEEEGAARDKGCTVVVMRRKVGDCRWWQRLDMRHRKVLEQVFVVFEAGTKSGEWGRNGESVDGEKLWDW